MDNNNDKPSNNNKKKHILPLIVITALLFIWIYYIINKWINKEKRIIWKVVSDEVFDKALILDWTWVIDKKEIDEKIAEEIEKKKDYSKIKSRIRVLCKLWTVEQVIWSSSFKFIKNDVDEIKKKQNNIEEFIYLELPQVVYESCPNTDSTFLNKILTYLQSDSIAILENDVFESENYKKYLDNITFDANNIDKKKIKEDKQYFDDILFNKNLEAIEWSYFSEYMSRSNDAKKFFFTTSIYSLTETNDILEKTLSNFENFLKELWFKNINELREFILKNNWLNNTNDLKNLLIKDYKELVKKSEEKLKIKINNELVNVETTYNFYVLNYKKIKDDSELNSLFNKIWKNYLMFSIINDDYADWLDEDWSWKEFFWNSIIWNGIIKVWYVYLFASSNK